MINIAIDGYAGSGKGELSKGLAQKFNLKHLDTGAILRAMALYLVRKGYNDFSQELVINSIKDFDVKVIFDGDTQITLLGGEDVSKTIRTENMGEMASKIAKHPEAMNHMNHIARTFANSYDCVLDGRNITSEVLPNADVKFFLTADINCRAQRRLIDDLNKGIDTNIDKVVESLKSRDYRDTHREFSTMVITPDSIVVDNTNMTIEETIAHCCNIVTEKLKRLNKI